MKRHLPRALFILAFTAGSPAAAEESLDASVRRQIEANWNIGARSDECADRKVGVIEVRIRVDAYGTVTDIQPLNLKDGDACALAEYQKTKRAILISSPLQLPKERAFETMRLRFYPDEFMQ